MEFINNLLCPTHLETCATFSAIYFVSFLLIFTIFLSWLGILIYYKLRYTSFKGESVALVIKKEIKYYSEFTVIVPNGVATVIDSRIPYNVLSLKLNGVPEPIELIDDNLYQMLEEGDEVEITYTQTFDKWAKKNLSDLEVLSWAHKK